MHVLKCISNDCHRIWVSHYTTYIINIWMLVGSLCMLLCGFHEYNFNLMFCIVHLLAEIAWNDPPRNGRSMENPGSWRKKNSSVIEEIQTFLLTPNILEENEEEDSSLLYVTGEIVNRPFDWMLFHAINVLLHQECKRNQ